MFLFDVPLGFAAPLDFAVSLFEIAPPKTIVGINAIVISAILQERIAPIIIPRAKVKSASNMMAIDSVERPLSKVTSSDRTLLRTPGAFSFESNQEISL